MSGLYSFDLSSCVVFLISFLWFIYLLRNDLGFVKNRWNFIPQGLVTTLLIMVNYYTSKYSNYTLLFILICVALFAAYLWGFETVKYFSEWFSGQKSKPRHGIKGKVGDGPNWKWPKINFFYKALC